MTNNRESIIDDEFRVIRHKRDVRICRSFWKGILISAFALLLTAGIMIWKWPNKSRPDSGDGVFDPIPVSPFLVVEPLGCTSNSVWTERIDTVVNDVNLAIYLPHNASPELCLGVPSTEGVILAAQAADIMAENGKILGAFVLKGKPLAWGLSKKGFCSIIEGEVTVGMSDNSPLFEEATEKGGFFFRQYPLVNEGVLIVNELKNKTMRKSLCVRAGQIFVAVSESNESMHDFAQALVDLGVENAIYLVGSRSAFGWYIDFSGTKHYFSPSENRTPYKNETYIIWK